MNTKRLLWTALAAALALQLGPAAPAQTIDANLASPMLIPDAVLIPGVGLDISGIVSQINVSGLGGMIDDVSVTLDITGDSTAYNGDYYAYLQYGSGLCVLLNTIDSDTGDNTGDGMDITLSDSAGSGIENAPGTAGELLTGTYAPDESLDSTFGGVNSADGAWTLYVADESPGDVGQLVDWSITLAVPDQGSTLLLLGMGAGLFGGLPIPAPPGQGRAASIWFSPCGRCFNFVT